MAIRIKIDGEEVFIRDNELKEMKEYFMNKFKKAVLKELNNRYNYKIKDIYQLKQIYKNSWKEKIEKLIKEKNINPKNFYFNLSVAGAGKTHEIVSKFNLGHDSVLVSFLNTTIDRVLEKIKELKPQIYESYFSITKEGKRELNQKKQGAKTIHSVAFRVLNSEKLLEKGEKESLDFEDVLKNKLSDYLNEKIAIFNSQNEKIKKTQIKNIVQIIKTVNSISKNKSYSTTSFFELPLYTLTFEIGWAYFLITIKDIIFDALIETTPRDIEKENKKQKEKEEPNGFFGYSFIKNWEEGSLKELKTAKIIKELVSWLFDIYDEVLHPLYFDLQDYLSFTSLLGFCQKHNLALFTPSYLKKAFISLNHKGKFAFIVDEAQDLNPLMIYLILLSYNEKVDYYFYGDPYQSINSFQGSSLEVFLSFIKLIKPPEENVIINNKTKRLNPLLTKYTNNIIQEIELTINQKIFKEIVSLKKSNKEEKEILEKLDRFFAGLARKLLGVESVLGKGDYEKGQIFFDNFKRLLENILYLTNKYKVVILLDNNWKVFEFYKLFGWLFSILPETTQRDINKSKDKLERSLKKVKNFQAKEVMNYVKEPKQAKLKFLKKVKNLLNSKNPLGIYYLKEYNEDYELLLKNANLIIKENKNLIISTINSYKGKEADFVFYFDFGRATLDYESKVNKLLLNYTAITRAFFFYRPFIFGFKGRQYYYNLFRDLKSYFEKSLNKWILIKLEEDINKLEEEIKQTKSSKNKIKLDNSLEVKRKAIQTPFDL